MSLDVQVLHACIADRKAYERVKGHINPKDFTPPVKFWWQLLGEYYQRDVGVLRADLDLIRELGSQRINNPKHRDTIMAVLGDGKVPSISNVVSAVLGLRRYNSAAEFAAAAMAGDSDKAKQLLETVNELWERDTFGDADERQYASSVEDLFAEIGSEKRIPVLPIELNRRIGGGVLPGHHVLIFGRTEIGKSTLAVNMAAGLVRKGHKVLYVGNEDSINAIKGRFVCRITGRTWQQVEANRDDSISLFRERGGETNLRLVHMQPGTVGAIRRDVEEFEPKFVVVDQIRNLASDEDGMTRKLEANAIRFRNLISEYGLVGISITQAGDRSQRHNEDSPVWLSSGDVDSSRVGLPAQCDLILGVGGNSEMIARGQRSISLVKNKLDSGPQSREGFICEFDLARAGVK